MSVEKRTLIDEIVPLVWVGTIEDARNFEGEIICVLETRPSEVPWAALHVPIVYRIDNERGFAVSRQALNDIAATISILRANSRRVLVHCGAGMERAPLTVAWYLHTRCGMTLDEAYDLLQHKRPIVMDRRAWLEPE